MAHKIISCAGYGNTGSSAATNFFEEFSNVLCVGSSGFEFMFLHESDGVIDLYRSIIEGHRLKTDLAIKRFIKLVYTLNYQNPSGPNYKDFFNGHFLDYTKEYLQSLDILVWDGEWYRNNDINIINNNDFIVKKYFYDRNFLNKKYSLYEPDEWRPSFSYRKPMYYCHVNEKEFIKKTKYYLRKLIEECDLEQKYEYLLFDQLVPSNCDNLYTQFFDDLYVIVVDRDPRDLYFCNKMFWNVGYIPSLNIDTFIAWFRSTRANSFKNDNIIHLNFESFIYDYDKTEDILINFVKTEKQNHIKKGIYLKPEKSMINTLLWLKYSCDNVEISNNIKRIEYELNEYCYNNTSINYANNNVTELEIGAEYINSYTNGLRISLFVKIIIASYCNTKLNKKISLKNLIIFPFEFIYQIIKSLLRELKFKYFFKSKFDFFELR